MLNIVNVTRVLSICKRRVVQVIIQIKITWDILGIIDGKNACNGNIIRKTTQYLILGCGYKVSVRGEFNKLSF